jgi:pimeloyl-ACP methyl ester carboxylesterase
MPFLRAIALLLALALPARAEPVFVLVHGAFVGAWYWDPVIAELEAAGAEAVPVTLRGFGARAGENAPGITAADHAADIAAAIEGTGSDEVILVAHSAAGKAATLAWDRARDRIVRIVYVEAIPPDAAGPVAYPEDRVALDWLAANQPAMLEAGLMPVPAAIAPDYRGRSNPMPLALLFGEVRLENGPLPDTPRTLILARDSALPSLRDLAEPLRTDPLWTVNEMDGGHDVARDNPKGLANVLLSLR